MENRERPILFSGEMVRAILSGRKTQTRRVMKPQPVKRSGLYFEFADDAPKRWRDCDDIRGLCPYGVPGDDLWVRETFAPLYCDHEDGAPRTIYRADYRDEAGRPRTVDDSVVSWKPAIHMPRAFSRICLEVTATCPQRLRDIAEEDAIAEGCGDFKEKGFPSAIMAFRGLWNSINGRREGCSWADSPWVWKITFRGHY